MERILSGTNTPGQSGPESNDNERIPHIPKSSIMGASPSDYLESYPGQTSSVDITFLQIYHIYQPLRSGSIWHKVSFKRSLTGLNSEFSFS